MKKDEMKDLPDDIKKALADHLELYLKDPEKAHYWDTAEMGLEGVIHTLLLRTRGRKTGQDRYNVLQYYKVDGRIAIIASKGGTVNNPAWYLNLEAEPECDVQIGGFKSKATARLVSDEERPQYWKAISTEQPIQLEYIKRTDRVFPILYLDFHD